MWRGDPVRALHAARFGVAHFHAVGRMSQAAAAASRAAEARLRLDADAALRARDEAERTRPVAAAAAAGGMISVAADVGLMQAMSASHWSYAIDARGARDGVQLRLAMPRKTRCSADGAIRT